MSEEVAFLAAIAAQPEEDTPRLAFADWLDEHDRAEWWCDERGCVTST